VSESEKRRLAPFPREWQTADRSELERLCGMARAARPLGAHGGPLNVAAGAPVPNLVPRIRPARASRTMASAGELPIAATASAADSVEHTVRTFAQQARAHHLPAIEAMVQLKGLLARTYTDPNSPARDRRAVRRWFVESYYFDSVAPSRDAVDQSR
jgi:hypothetical protein